MALQKDEKRTRRIAERLLISPDQPLSLMMTAGYFTYSNAMLLDFSMLEVDGEAITGNNSIYMQNFLTTLMSLEGMFTSRQGWKQEFFASRETISSVNNMSLPTITKMKRIFKELGIISIEDRVPSNGREKVSHFVINYEYLLAYMQLMGSVHMNDELVRIYSNIKKYEWEQMAKRGFFPTRKVYEFCNKRFKNPYKLEFKPLKIGVEGITSVSKTLLPTLGNQFNTINTNINTNNKKETDITKVISAEADASATLMEEDLDIGKEPVKGVKGSLTTSSETRNRKKRRLNKTELSLLPIIEQWNEIPSTTNHTVVSGAEQSSTVKTICKLLVQVMDGTLYGEQYSLEDIRWAIDIYEQMWHKDYYPMNKSSLPKSLRDFIQHYTAGTTMMKDILTEKVKLKPSPEMLDEFIEIIKDYKEERKKYITLLEGAFTKADSSDLDRIMALIFRWYDYYGNRMELVYNRINPHFPMRFADFVEYHVTFLNEKYSKKISLGHLHPNSKTWDMFTAWMIKKYDILFRASDETIHFKMMERAKMLRDKGGVKDEDFVHVGLYTKEDIKRAKDNDLTIILERSPLRLGIME